METRASVPKTLKDMRVFFMRVDESSAFTSEALQSILNGFAVIKDKQGNPASCCMLVHALDEAGRHWFQQRCQSIAIQPNVVFYLNDFLPAHSQAAQALLGIINKELKGEDSTASAAPKLLPQLSERINVSADELGERYPAMLKEARIALAKQEAVACFALKMHLEQQHPDTFVSLWPLTQVKDMPSCSISPLPFLPLAAYLTAAKQAKKLLLAAKPLQPTEQDQLRELLSVFKKLFILKLKFKAFHHQHQSPQEFCALSVQPEMPFRKTTCGMALERFVLSVFPGDFDTWREGFQSEFKAAYAVYEAPLQAAVSIDKRIGYLAYTITQLEQECDQRCKDLYEIWVKPTSRELKAKSAIAARVVAALGNNVKMSQATASLWRQPPRRSSMERRPAPAVVLADATASAPPANTHPAPIDSGLGTSPFGSRTPTLGSSAPS